MRFILVLLFCLPFSVCAVTPHSKAVSNFVNHPQLCHADISLLVVDAASGAQVAEYRSERMATPASTAKLITTATALEALGKGFLFKTDFLIDGTIHDGVLKGNLYIYGHGDPTLGSRYLGDSLFLAKFVEKTRAAGISKVEGNVIADASFWSDEGVSPKWSWEDMGNYYGSATYALSIFDDIMEVHFKSGAPGSLATITDVRPMMPDLMFETYVRADNTKSDNAYFYGAPFALKRIVRGTIPARSDDFVSKADIPNPPLACAAVFHRALLDSSIVVTGVPQATFRMVKAKRTPLFTFTSPELSEVIKDINHRSNNHYAEHVYRYLGTLDDDKTIYGGSDFIERFWKRRGLDVDQLLLYDGCGLSASDAVSARFLVDVLLWEKNHSDRFDVFFASLPVAGKSGTVKNLLKGTALEGKVHAKSGSISGTQCYAGYIVVSNRTLAFAIMVNNFRGARSDVRTQFERFLLDVSR